MRFPGGIQAYYIYITTNKSKTVLYIGVTNDLKRRLNEHEQDSKSSKKHFAGKYIAYHLVYWEKFKYISKAIKREKELKGWLRIKKEKLIIDFNPEWKFFNDEIE